jgi:WD40 repeat protein
MTVAPAAATDRAPKTPYVGLVPYDEHDAAFFFGRDEEKHIVAGNLRASRLTIVYGPSGVGKTSLLQAGVVHELRDRVLAAASTRPERAPFAICVMREWRDDPLTALVEAIRTSAVEALGGQELPPARRGEPVVEVLRSWTQRVRTILVVLDQFEDYFLYHPDEDADGTFAAEFARIVNETNLRVNFALSIREDAWAKLDHFEGRIPALFGNYVRVQHLNRRTGRQAIEEPVAEWNRRLEPGEPPYTIEAALTDAVLDAAAGGRLAPAAGGVGADSEAADADAVEAPFLQLVMERLWRATAEAGSRELGLARLQELGGAQRIVENHLLEALGALAPAEQALAADLFRFLVTRSKTKIAHSASDLAEWTKRPQGDVAAVLGKLCRGESGRILRALSPPSAEDAERYELFHDVLAEPVLEWRRGYEQRRDRRVALRRYARIVGALLALVVVFAAAGIWALRQKAEADDQRASAEAARRAATSLALASSASAQRGSRVDVALLLGLEANRASRRPEARDAMIAALEAVRRSGADALVHAQSAVRSVALSRDGRTLAAADGETVRLWDLDARRSLGTVRGRSGAVGNVALSADGGTLVSAGADGTVQLWNVRTLEPLTQPLRGQEAVEDTALGPALSTLATVSLKTARRLRPRDEGLAPSSVAFSPDGRTFVVADEFGEANLSSTRTGRRSSRFLSNTISQVAFGPDGRTLVTLGFGGRVVMRNARTLRPLRRPLQLDAGGASSMAVGGQRLAVGEDGMVRVWNLKKRAGLGEALPARARGARSVAFSADGRTLVTANGPRMRLWDAATFRPRGGLPGHDGPIRSIALTEDGRTLAAAGGDTVRVWDVHARRARGGPLEGVGKRCRMRLMRLSRPPFGVVCEMKAVAFSENGRMLAAAGNGRTVRLWDVPTREPIGELRGHRAFVSSVAFSPAGSTLASASYDGTVRLWDAKARRPLRELRMQGTGAIFDVAFSPDGGTLAAGASDGTVVLWDAATGKRRAVVSGHGGWVISVGFSPDGRTLASGATDGSIRLWDARTRRSLGQTLRSPVVQGNRYGPPWVESIAFSADGRTLATAGLSSAVLVWRDLLWRDWSDLRDQVCRLVLGKLTEEEWSEYAPEVEPGTTCPGA